MDQVGCLLSEDCAAGLSCDTSLPQPTCRDDNECDPAGPHGHVGAAHCGNHTTCTNTAGSFTCGCESDRYTDFQAKVGCRDKDECTEVRQTSYLVTHEELSCQGGHNCHSLADCTNTYGGWNCTCKPGYTGVPTSKVGWTRQTDSPAHAQCYDLDECAFPEFNTCSGGLYPYGFSVDLYGPAEAKKFYVGPAADGFSHDFVFEAKTSGNRRMFIYLCDSSDLEANCYKIILNDEGKNVVIEKDDVEIKSKTMMDTDEMKIKSDSFKIFRIRLVFVNPELRIKVGAGYDRWKRFIDAKDDTAPIAVEWIWLGGAMDDIYWGPAYVRNFRPYGATEVCGNHVGSYECTSTEEEYMAIGYGGHTTSGSNYPARFSVITKDESTCTNHKIPILSPGRYAPGVVAVDNYLFVCGGHFYAAR